MACMPNTIPAIDTQALPPDLSSCKRNANNVYPVGAVSKGRKGEEQPELGQLVEGGVAFTDDGTRRVGVVIRTGVALCQDVQQVIMQHCQVPELTVGGVMNRGFESMRWASAACPRRPEDIMVAARYPPGGNHGRTAPHPAFRRPDRWSLSEKGSIAESSSRPRLARITSRSRTTVSDRSTRISR